MRRTTLALLLVFAAFTAFAQTKPEAKPEMKPDPKLRQLDYFVGTWGCTGTAFANPWSPEHPTGATVSSAWQLDDYWLAFTYAEMKSDKNPMPFAVSGFFGYDAAQKKFTLSGFDNMGGSAVSTSAGWVGDVLTYEGPWNMGGGMMMKGRDTFTKKTADQFVHAAFVEQGGKWMKLDEETCTKSL